MEYSLSLTKVFSQAHIANQIFPLNDDCAIVLFTGKLGSHLKKELRLTLKDS